MRKVYILTSYWQVGKPFIEGVFTSRKKAEYFKEKYFKGIECEIKTEVLI